jgi:hypothetical protein
MLLRASLRSKRPPHVPLGGVAEPAASGLRRSDLWLGGLRPLAWPAMSDVAAAPPEPPRAHARVVYLGPVAPHWEIHSDFGDRQIIDEFRGRVLARLVLLPPHDPQFRRNRERVIRDAERENILLDWDLGLPDEDDA